MRGGNLVEIFLVLSRIMKRNWIFEKEFVEKHKNWSADFERSHFSGTVRDVYKVGYCNSGLKK